MFKFNTMTIWNSKQPKTLSTYTLNHIHHVFCWVKSPCGLSDWHLNLILRQFKFITSIKIWVHSHTGPFKLDTVLSLHLFSALIQNPQCTTNQCNILSYSPPLMVPKQVNPCCLHLHCHDKCTVIIIQTRTPQSSNVGVFSIWGLQCRCFLDQPCRCCCVCYTYNFVIWNQSEHSHFEFL